ncbi:putative cell division control protein [Lophium mytilinum]|uniref:Putative cell division control protein n=1 Tax=Lophium mytilinum TaxID=390894 RepID=A0A6A6QVR5_9PEZI|nr:putative cell division control protein [Lophium mytilinum]
MPVKGGVWTNVEDEVLKAAVSKYGLQQWSRCASLLARKSAKQCKARWNEWLDPSVRKVEWSREEDEKLLTASRLLPGQWRSIASIISNRTATQCLERYQKLLDEAEAKESGELGLAGPEGGESAPTADDVRKLRPGEIDPEPESRPARPDAQDMEEDELSMLSEARARLANVNGKKAKRKARERELATSHRLSVLQKRRELKAAGINIKIVTKKPGQMDYSADIPLEKQVPAGFYDTTEEQQRNERQREAFDPRKQQLANKRKADQDEPDDRKRKKNDNGHASVAAAAAKAAQAQKIREAERSSKRRGLVLPAPQVSEGELEDIVKMGMAGERASQYAGSSENDATRGLIGNYSHIVGGTPIRTPRAAPEEDHIAKEIQNARARTDTQSALLGGENPDYEEGAGTAGLAGTGPRSQMFTPNPMATPFRQGGAVGATPMRAGPGATPMLTPRDNFRLNEAGGMQLIGQTPKDVKRHEIALRQSLKSKFAALPKPKETEWEFELPEEQQGVSMDVDMTEEDAGERDRRNKLLREAAERAEFKRQTQVVQKSLPRPSTVDADTMLKQARANPDPVLSAIQAEMALLMANDATKFGGGRVKGTSRPLDTFDDEALNKARAELALEVAVTDDMELPEPQLPGRREFDNIQNKLMETAEKANKIETKLGVTLGGYQKRAKLLRKKIEDAAEALEDSQISLETARMQVGSEDLAITRRLEQLRAEVALVSRKEREAQELYRARKEELDSLEAPVNGVH